MDQEVQRSLGKKHSRWLKTASLKIVMESQAQIKEIKGKHATEQHVV